MCACELFSVTINIYIYINNLNLVSGVTARQQCQKTRGDFKLMLFGPGIELQGITIPSSLI